jgi:tetratricopeptide (TPR) repeat protein
LGRICAAEGRYEEALDHYDKALALAGDWGATAVRRRISAVYLAQGRLKEALDCLEKLLPEDLDEGSALAVSLDLCVLARCYLKMGPEHAGQALGALLAAKSLMDKHGITHPDAPMEQLLDEFRDNLGAELFERTVRSIDLDATEFSKYASV